MSSINDDKRTEGASDNFKSTPETSANYVDEAAGETARVVDHVAERKLCRKFDIRLLPVLAVMCKLRISQLN